MEKPDKARRTFLKVGMFCALSSTVRAESTNSSFLGAQFPSSSGSSFKKLLLNNHIRVAAVQEFPGIFNKSSSDEFQFENILEDAKEQILFEDKAPKPFDCYDGGAIQGFVIGLSWPAVSLRKLVLFDQYFDPAVRYHFYPDSCSPNPRDFRGTPILVSLILGEQVVSAAIRSIRPNIFTVKPYNLRGKDPKEIHPYPGAYGYESRLLAIATTTDGSLVKGFGRYVGCPFSSPGC
jgi:hypothetical protein